MKCSCQSEDMEQIDPLRIFLNTAACPVCGCLEPYGTIRCPECGTFHSGAIMEEREAPVPSEVQEIEKAELDPSAYSLGPSFTLPDESFEESEDVKEWDGGSSDFSFDDSDDPLPAVESETKNFVEPEVVVEDQSIGDSK